MPYSKEAQRQGGRAPATESQKQAARQTALTHQPWKRPKSPIGKLVTRYNAVKPGVYRRFVKSWLEDFDRGCQEAEAAISAFMSDRNQHLDCYYSLNIKRLQGQNSGDCWCLFVVYVVYLGTEKEIQARVEVADTVRLKYGSQGKYKWEALLTEVPQAISNLVS